MLAGADFNTCGSISLQIKSGSRSIFCEMGLIIDIGVVNISSLGENSLFEFEILSNL